MAITSLNQYIAAPVQSVSFTKTSLTTVANIPSSVFAQSGDPGAGTLAGTSTAAGVVPTDATAGCPSIGSFGTGALGYLSRVEFSSSVACRIALYDLLWKGGAYAFNASQALSAQPAYTSRLPNGSYAGVELWMEQVTVGTGIQSVAVTYNDSAAASQTTGTISAGAAAAVARMTQLPLVAGGNSIETVTHVTGSVATVGTFNILVLRRLWRGRVPINAGGDVHSLMKTGMPQVFTNSALFMIVTPDSTVSGVPDCRFEIANG